MKYVAFVDTLGFRQRISRITHQQAVDIIRLFNQTVFNLWQEMGFDSDPSIKGRTFSDSVIIHTSGGTLHDLDKILRFLIALYKVSITQCDLPLRGGLSFGAFDDLKALEFDNLQKGMIVGTAFIDAYLLESSNGIKGSKILFGQNVNEKIEQHPLGYQSQKVKNDQNGNSIHELRWGDINYLNENNNKALYKLIDLATESKWLDHYYGTLETFLIRESADNKYEIFAKIIDKLKLDYKYNDLDNFIENYLKSESANFTKRSFLAYLRKNL